MKQSPSNLQLVQGFNMKIFKFYKAAFIATIAVFSLTSQAFAQSKTLVVDYNKVVNDSRAGKSIARQLKSIAKTMQSEVDVQVKNLESEGKSVQASTKGLKTMADLKSRPDLQQKIKKFEMNKQKTAIEMQYKDAEMKKTQAVALKKVFDKMNTIVASIARERGADLVLDASTSYYASPSVDITATVLSRLDSQMPSVSVSRQRLPRKAIK